RSDGPDEAESTPMDRLDVAGLARRIGQRSAQIADAAREGRLAHDGVAPNNGEQVVLRDESIGMLDEMAQGREGLRREIQQSLATPRPPGLRFDADRRTIPGTRVAQPPRHFRSNRWLWA